MDPKSGPSGPKMGVLRPKNDLKMQFLTFILPAYISRHLSLLRPPPKTFTSSNWSLNWFLTSSEQWILKKLRDTNPAATSEMFVSSALTNKCSLPFQLPHFKQSITVVNTPPSGTVKSKMKRSMQPRIELTIPINTDLRIYTGVNPTKIFYYPFLLA